VGNGFIPKLILCREQLNNQLSNNKIFSFLVFQVKINQSKEENLDKNKLGTTISFQSVFDPFAG